MTQFSNSIEATNWKENLSKLVKLNSPERVVIISPTKMGKSSQEVLAATLVKKT